MLCRRRPLYWSSTKFAEVSLPWNIGKVRSVVPCPTMVSVRSHHLLISNHAFIISLPVTCYFLGVWIRWSAELSRTAAAAAAVCFCCLDCCCCCCCCCCCFVTCVHCCCCCCCCCCCRCVSLCVLCLWLL